MSWPKQLTVDKRIVHLLSAATYENFPRALRELVSNSYDADATTVLIDIDTEKKTIVVTDDGIGMTPDEFDFFLRIAGQSRLRTRKTDLGRVRIGQFGIGFLAMFPFCKTIKVESTVAGSTLVFIAHIPASQFFTLHDQDIQDIRDGIVQGEEFDDDSGRAAHFTRITLSETTTLLDKYLAQRQELKQSRHSIRSYPGFERLRWELQEILPLPHSKDSAVAPFVDLSPFDFNVYLNKEILRANDYVTDVLAHSNGYESIGNIRFSWAIGTPWKATKPDEARGLRIRLHRVGVGPRQYFDLGIAGRTFSRLHWLSGEVNIVSGLDECITVDRDTFTQSQDYDDFRDFFRARLRELAYFVENVDESKRKLLDKLNQSARAAVGPTREIVAKEIDKLEGYGFTFQSVKKPVGQEPPASFDMRKREVVLNADLIEKGERILLGDEEWKVFYERWKPSDSHDGVYRLEGENRIVLNLDYLLFSGSYKDTFRRLQLILAFADRRSHSKREFIDKLQQELVNHFGEYRK